MTPATSVSFFRPEFNDFLYAPIGSGGNGMPVSVLSALSRLDVDPWAEAAELSGLPKDTAVRRLAALIARVPGAAWAQADSRATAHRLIELLPYSGGSKAPSAATGRGLPVMSDSTVVKMLICAALVVTVLFIAAGRDPSSRDGRVDPPASNTVSAPQTVPQ